MQHIDVGVDHAGVTTAVGCLYRHPHRGKESVSFRYHDAWLEMQGAYAIDPSLPLMQGVFSPSEGQKMFGALSDTAPDQWGRRLMRKAEHFRSAHRHQTPRMLSEVDYIMGVTDASRMGALRFQYSDQPVYQAPEKTGVPKIVDLGRLMQITHHVLKEQVDADDLKILFAPGTSLGGARPKASVLDREGRLSIAKFPKEQDEYSIERWEAVAMSLAEQAGMGVAPHELIEVLGRPVYLSRRFDRCGAERVPFMSAMSMMGAVDGESASYLDLVDLIGFNSAEADVQRKELFRRMVFNILISNVDDHMRNHGFLRSGSHGWCLSPAYDLNPTPQDIKPRVLTTNITAQDGTCDIGLAMEVAELFDIGKTEACQIIRQVAETTSGWRAVAKSLGATPSESERMASAFEHQDLHEALAL